MKNGAFKPNAENNLKANEDVTFFNPHQEMLKELYKLEPDECLRIIAGKLKDILHCETVCILLWNEGRQELITEYECGLPKDLDRPEAYALDQGLTGKIIFSEKQWVRCVIDMAAHRIYNEQTKSFIDEGTTKWHNMEAYQRSSAHGDFRSLLGAPFFVRSQKLGAVKLINKLDAQERLADEGFDVQDFETLSYFLDVIEHVVEIKRNEKRVQSLLRIGQKIISTASGYEEVLTEITASCAEALNYRICLIRLLEDNQLTVRASNMPLSGTCEPEVRYAPSLSAVEHKIPLKGSYYEEIGKSPRLKLESAEGRKQIKLAKVSNKFIRFLHQHALKSFLIVPIIQRGNVIGTIECYTSLRREFSAQELDAIRLYIDALVITTINSRQQLLLTNLIEMQRIGAVSDEDGGEEEEKAIKGVLRRTREWLGWRLKLHSVIFSEDRLARSKLNCRSLYGTSKNELKSVLGAKAVDALLSELNKSGRRAPVTHYRAEPTKRTRKSGREPLDIIQVCILPEGEGSPLGVLLLGLQEAGSEDDFAEQVARLGADYLGVMLGNIEEYRRSKGILKIIDDASNKEALPDIYRFILNQTTDFFGFDFGAISQINHIARRIETVMACSAKPDLVDPNQWMNFSSYAWDEYDILTDVFKRKSDVIIDAAGPGEPRDPRLNEKIYTRFNHGDLARIWVPFKFRRDASGREQDDLVLGIIEAGYHRHTQERINQQKRDLFVRFVDSCANSLQRVTLLEERRSIDDVLKKFNQERNPEEVLRKLLQASVDLVKGDWGDITFLTHYDDKIRFLDPTISYKLPALEPGRFIHELEVGTTGKTGIVGFVAGTEKPYWSNDVKKDSKYIEECEEVESELAVPLRFSGQIIGVLDINSNKKDWFDERKASLVQTVADQGTVLYQNARLDEPLTELISPFNPFASPEEIYEKVIKIIEDFLITKTVSVWKRIADGDTFKLELVAASEGLWEKYKEAGISTLPPTSITGRAVAEKKPVPVTQEEIRAGFDYPEFAEENGLRSLTIVPILVGDEIYGVINVFSRRDTKLFTEEVVIVRILASKAAIALQSAMLVQSFNDIAKISLSDDINSILKRIALNALDVLHAEPVILFRYDASAKQFDADAVVAGKLYYEDVQIATNENDMANMILKEKEPLYLKHEDDYLAFERSVNRHWHSDRLPSDFWHREKVESLAALKLEHRGEIVGVMFINYREPQVFPDYVERLIKVFASQASSAIYNAKISEQNKKFWETRRADSLSLSVSEIVYSLAHNSGHLLNQISDSFGKIDDLLSRGRFAEAQLNKLKEEVNNVKEPLDAILKDFSQLKTYRQLDALRLEDNEINSLVRRSLDMIRDTFRKQRITIDERYTANIPLIQCDETQVQHVFLNLFLNAIEAMGHKGKLSVTTSVDWQTNEVEIRVSDTGPGIPRELRNKIFELYFSTKKQKAGSGIGLPISRYIVNEHGGHIEIGPSSSKGATFSVYLPIND
ncbi:MAG: GAF domain-containing protein [Blastocatellia bacterium]